MVSAKIIFSIIVAFYLSLAINQTIIHTGNVNQDIYNATHPGMGYNYNFDRGR